jgi:hypothetical protein
VLCVTVPVAPVKVVRTSVVSDSVVNPETVKSPEIVPPEVSNFVLAAAKAPFAYELASLDHKQR